MKKIFGFIFILSAFLVFTNPVLAISENITQINFISSPQTINVDTASAVLATQTQNAENTSESVSETTTLNYTSTSETGQFSDANISAETCNESTWSTSLTLNLASTRANKGFCYKDSTLGTHTLTVSAEGTSWTPATQDIVITEIPPTPTVIFIVRNGDLIIFQGAVPLPDIETDRNVLAILRTIDENSETFSISNIQNFSFGSYLKCILPQDGTELCDNWQYAVGSLTPFSSIDATLLSGGETVGIYFGTSHQLVLSTNAITTGGSLNATAQKYDYETNIWNPLSGVNIGVTLPNPDDLFNPTVVSTHPVDALGIANITITGVNTYNLGIVEDFYFPSYAVTVSEVQGGGGGGQNNPPATFDVQKAIDYLKSVQSEDGSFGDSNLYTDWTAIAYGALNVSGNSLSSLLEYLNSNNELSSLLTDNERRAMALLALDKNPYSFNGVNYIEAIVNDFDGTQFGDADLINDDIFALIPLKNAGYTSNDDITKKDVAFLISEQNSNGSWIDSVDITAATIQALKPFETIEGVSEALFKAKNYLINQQNSDGGWGNSVFSTSWAMQAESALDESWEKNGKSGLDYLATQQVADGAVSPSLEELKNRIWATSYAIAAASLKPWREIMQSVSKPANQNNNKNNSNDSGASRSGSDTNSPNPQILTNPVICPKGDLFSATTGQLCTAFIDPEPVSNRNIVTNVPVPNIQTLQTQPPVVTAQDLEPDEVIPEIDVNALVAAPTEALPENTTSRNTVPIILGTLSGIFLLYIAFKFLAK